MWYEMQEKNGDGFGDNNMAMRHHPPRDKSASGASQRNEFIPYAYPGHISYFVKKNY